MDDFQVVQQQFTEAIRHQTDNPFDQIKPERFAVYLRLIRNNIVNVTIQHPAKAYCCNFEPL